ALLPRRLGANRGPADPRRAEAAATARARGAAGDHPGAALRARALAGVTAPGARGDASRAADRAAAARAGHGAAAQQAGGVRMSATARSKLNSWWQRWGLAALVVAAGMANAGPARA